MKKYKNVRAVKARKCQGYTTRLDKEGFLHGYCIGVPEPFLSPKCNGYKCKCTEYKYKGGKFV